MATIDDLRAALIEASAMCAKAASGSVMSAMATAGLVGPDELPPGMDMPHRNLSDAGSLASQAAQAAAAARDLAQAVTALPPSTTP